jgi:hypothetical protein
MTTEDVLCFLKMVFTVLSPWLSKDNTSTNFPPHCQTWTIDQSVLSATQSEAIVQLFESSLPPNYRICKGVVGSCNANRGFTPTLQVREVRITDSVSGAVAYHTHIANTIPYQTQTKPNPIKPNQTQPNQTEPNQTNPNQTQSNQTKPNQTKPSQS